MSSYLLRPVTVAEIPEVLAFWRSAAEDTDRADDEVVVRALLARDPEALIVATAADRIVGSLIAGWDGWRAHLYRFAVHPEHRRRGLGRQLLAAAERRFVALGGRRADAMVLDDNALAHTAWTAAGYVRQTDCSRWVRPLPAAVAGE